MFQISEKILLTIWVGAMWSVGYIVAPVLFQMLDKPVAGNVAGQLFPTFFRRQENVTQNFRNDR